MYTLRTIEEDGREVNLYLGNHYTVYRKGKIAQKDFEQHLDNYFGDSGKQDAVEAFIDADNLPTLLPIFYCKFHYIVTESGKTFQKL